MTTRRPWGVLLALGVLGPTLVVPISIWHHHAPNSSCSAPTPQPTAAARPPDECSSAPQHECSLCVVSTLTTAGLPLLPAAALAAPALSFRTSPAECVAVESDAPHWARAPPPTFTA
ncbi:MAG: hypothetical protein AB1601_11455 [Planctomycetota bacterium]